MTKALKFTIICYQAKFLIEVRIKITKFPSSSTKQSYRIIAKLLSGPMHRVTRHSLNRHPSPYKVLLTRKEFISFRFCDE